MNYKTLLVVVLGILFLGGCKKALLENTRPTITNLSGGGVYYVGDTVTLSALIGDLEDNIKNLDVNWSTSVNITFFDRIQLLNGEVEAKAVFTDVGFYSIELRVVDSSGEVNTMSLSIEIKEQLDPVEILGIYSFEFGIRISLSEFAQIYQRFELYRSIDSLGSYDLVSEIENPRYYGISDSTAANIGQIYFYKIHAYLTNELQVQSKIVSHRHNLAPLNIGDYNIVKLETDKKRPYLYALDSKTSSLLFINTNTFEVEKNIVLIDRPIDFEIQMDNEKMYILYENSHKISIIDLETQSKFKTISTTGDDGKYYYGYEMLHDDEFGDLIVLGKEEGIYFYEAKTGEFFYYLNKSCNKMVSSPNKKFLYFVNSNIDLGLFKLEIINGKPVIIDETVLNKSSHYGEICISGDGKFLIVNKERRNTQDISTVLGTFNEDIYATNFDGSLAVGRTNIWDAKKYIDVRRLPLSIYLEEQDVNAVFNANEFLYVWSSDFKKILAILCD